MKHHATELEALCKRDGITAELKLVRPAGPVRVSLTTSLPNGPEPVRTMLNLLVTDAVAKLLSDPEHESHTLIEFLGPEKYAEYKRAKHDIDW